MRLNLKIAIVIISLQWAGITVFSAERCSDELFLRRAYLTATGGIPNPSAVVGFLKSTDSDKREKLIDSLLDSELFLKYMQMHWGDILRIKSEFPSNLWPNGVQAYNRWLYSHLMRNTPYNTMVYELITSEGSNFRSPAVNFFRAFQKRTPENFYSNINLLFLGQRTYADNGYLCFSQIRFKSTKEWKEEIISIDRQMNIPQERVCLSDGTLLNLEKGNDWRKDYAAWLTSTSNRRFAEVMVNRLWYWVFGKGIVNEPDDWRTDNPPSNPGRLASLTDFFVSHGYNLRLLMREILLSSEFSETPSPQGEFEPLRLPAEVIVDALASVTGIWSTYHSRVPEPFTFYPPETRATHLGDATVSSSELELFGKVSRDVSLESQRNNSLTSRQLLYLMNSSDLEQRIRKSPILKEYCRRFKNLNRLADEITLLVLSRHATRDEQLLYRNYMKDSKLSLKEVATDIMWMQINSNEFLYLF